MVVFVAVRRVHIGDDVGDRALGDSASSQPDNAHTVTLLRSESSDVGAHEPTVAALVRGTMDDTSESLGTDAPSNAVLSPDRLERQYVDLLLAGERHQAAELIISHADAGVSVKDLYLQVFEPAQVEIGQRWQRDEITVAHEHYCTAATQLIMSMLYPRMFGGERNGRRLVACTVAGNLHEIGARMVADFFEFDGWDTYFTGADTPLQAVVATVAERDAHVVALSATMSEHVAGVAELVEAIRAEPATADVIVLVGGRPFKYDTELWSRIGADGTAPDAQGAVDLATAMLSAP